ncbi:unnamed protein product [Urochloa humidicola]
MQDLRSLRRSCKRMYQVCKSRHATKCILVQRVLEREVFTVAHYNGDYRENLIGKLAEAGNKEACFRDGLCIFFDVNRSGLDYPHHSLEGAAYKGHNLAAYTFAMCLYRRSGGATDDEKVKELIRKLEDQDGSGAVDAEGVGVRQRWMNHACVVARLLSADMVETYDPPYSNNWAPVAKPKRIFAHIVSGNWDKCYREPLHRARLRSHHRRQLRPATGNCAMG